MCCTLRVVLLIDNVACIVGVMQLMQNGELELGNWHDQSSLTTVDRYQQGLCCVNQGSVLYPWTEQFSISSISLNTLSFMSASLIEQSDSCATSVVTAQAITTFAESEGAPLRMSDTHPAQAIANCSTCCIS
ncbi:hypothetical protein ABBQ32_011611 [Trebouxia sp. C0010 RCD-2024]